MTRQGPIIVVVGCGAIVERFYLPALLGCRPHLPELILVDTDPTRLASLAERFSIPRCSVELDAVIDAAQGAIVATPHRWHFPIAEKLISRGLPTYVEKPLADKFTDAQRLVALAADNRTHLLVNNLRRLYPSFIAIRKLLLGNDLGRPLQITWREGLSYAWPTVSGFYFRHAADGVMPPPGVLLDFGAHVIDILCWWLGGTPSVISCFTDSFGGPEAMVKLELRQEQCFVQVDLSYLEKQSNAFAILCERGRIDGVYNEWFTYTVTDARGRSRLHRVTGGISSRRGFASRLMANFIDVIHGNAAPLIRGADVLPSLEVIDSAYSLSKRFDMPWYRPWMPLPAV